MGSLSWPLLALAVLLVGAVAHFLFWGWVYRLRLDSDAELTAICRDGWALRVSHFRPATRASGPPVILCHGLAANRYNLCLPGTHSLAGFLRARGHEVFVCDLRGSGASSRPPPGRSFSSVGFDDHVLQDAPAVLELALRTTGQNAAFWVGHSMGGLVGLALAQTDAAPQLAGVVALGSPTRWQFHRPVVGRLLQLSASLAWSGRVHQKWPARIVAPWLGYFPFPLGDVALNPQNIEPKLYRRIAYVIINDVSRKMLRQFAGWFTRDGWSLESTGKDLRAGLADIRCPVLLAGGALDVLAPPQAVEAAFDELHTADKALLLFGKSRGDKQDYGHGDLIFGRYAPEEVFPQVESWLSTRGAAQARAHGTS